MRARLVIVLAAAAALLLAADSSGAPVLTKARARRATVNETRYLCNNLEIKCDVYKVTSCRPLGVRRVNCDGRLDFLEEGLACTWTEQWYLRPNGRLEQNVKKFDRTVKCFSGSAPPALPPAPPSLPPLPPSPSLPPPPPSG